MIATLSFFIENIYNRCIVLLVQWFTNLLSPDGVHPQISSSLRLLVLCLVRPTCSSYITVLFVSFFKELISFFTNATPAFSTLWFFFLLQVKMPFNFLTVTALPYNSRSWIHLEQSIEQDQPAHTTGWSCSTLSSDLSQFKIFLFLSQSISRKTKSDGLMRC